MNLSIELMSANMTKRETTRHHKSPSGKSQCHYEVAISKNLNLNLVKPLDLSTNL